MNSKEVLELKTRDGNTIMDYLKDLLFVLWKEKDGFSGKRPFGNSGFEYDLYYPLIKAGVIKGKIDKYDCIE